jgi:hypothetical protein
MTAAKGGEGMETSRQRVIHPCPACGGPVDCGMANGEATCWCFALPPVLPVPVDAASARCYCSRCLQRSIAERTEEKRCI